MNTALSSLIDDTRCVGTVKTLYSTVECTTSLLAGAHATLGIGLLVSAVALEVSRSFVEL